MINFLTAPLYTRSSYQAQSLEISGHCCWRYSCSRTGREDFWPRLEFGNQKIVSPLRSTFSAPTLPSSFWSRGRPLDEKELWRTRALHADKREKLSRSSNRLF
mmetsp:Transcript_22211/g.52302  ORF Transcript_22211/g.52302 Transcript_22211/m.52302 type:complete len:103 (+) Transcript_22211:145-453(+)